MLERMVVFSFASNVAIRFVVDAIPVPIISTLESTTGWNMAAKLDFGHSGGMAERVDDAFAERWLDFRRLG